MELIEFLDFSTRTSKPSIVQSAQGSVQNYIVVGDNFTDKKAELACKSGGYKGVLWWKTAANQRGNDNATGIIVVKQCNDDAENLLDCNMSLTAELDATKNNVIIHCQGMDIIFSFVSLHFKMCVVQ